MNVAFLLKQYFDGAEGVSIDVFDAHSLNDVYQQVLNTLTAHFEIELSVLQALSYCFWLHFNAASKLNSNNKLFPPAKFIYNKGTLTECLCCIIA